MKLVPLLAALVLAAGCYQGNEYVRPHTVVAGERPELLRHVVAVASARGLHIVELDPAQGKVTAFSAIEVHDGIAMRDRWQFFIDDEEDIFVEMHPEMRSGGLGRPTWERAEVVCDCYRYTRENDMLQAIRAHAGLPPMRTASAQNAAR